MKGKARRLLSWVCVLALCMSLLPVTALSSGSNDNNEVTSTSSLTPGSAQNNDVEISKTATRTGEDTWNITMTVKAKAKPIESEPLELVLLLDRSGSMACVRKMHINIMIVAMRGDMGDGCSSVRKNMFIPAERRAVLLSRIQHSPGSILLAQRPRI